jgi:hypothetical protein
MPMGLIHRWSARAQQAGIPRLPSSTLPRRAASVADGPTRGYRSWLP